MATFLSLSGVLDGSGCIDLGPGSSVIVEGGREVARGKLHPHRHNDALGGRRISKRRDAYARNSSGHQVPRPLDQENTVGCLQGFGTVRD